MWEIDELIQKSIRFIQKLELTESTKRNIIWSLENIPKRYDFDAGSYKFTETDDDFKYKEVNPFKIAIVIAKNIDTTQDKTILYDWIAFLLNFWTEYFSKKNSLEDVKINYLQILKKAYNSEDFSSYEPIHQTLTLYKEGNEWFQKEQNELILWFFKINNSNY